MQQTVAGQGRRWSGGSRIAQGRSVLFTWPALRSVRPSPQHPRTPALPSNFVGKLLGFEASSVVCELCDPRLSELPGALVSLVVKKEGVTMAWSSPKSCADCSVAGCEVRLLWCQGLAKRSVQAAPVRSMRWREVDTFLCNGEAPTPRARRLTRRALASGVGDPWVLYPAYPLHP